MFDDLNSQSNNQPTGQPDKQPQPNSNSVQPQRLAPDLTSYTAEPEDIFANTDKAAVNAKPAQFMPKIKNTANTPAAMGVNSANEAQDQSSFADIGDDVKKSQNKKYIAVGIIIIVTLVVMLIGMVVLAYLKTKENNPTDAGVVKQEQTVAPIDSTADNTENTALENTAAEDNADNTSDNNVSGIEDLNNQIAPVAENSTVILDEITDTDNDGLTDSEENRLGTSITNTDTDGDGLFDRQEVRIYNTDPLNPDTDGDGFIDGEEVENGYNPAGPGQLYELPQ